MFVGLNAYFALPVAPLPQVDFPTISVEARLPGASAETMATSVATPLERSLANVSGVTDDILQLAGTSQIVLQFDLSRSIDGAAQDCSPRSMRRAACCRRTCQPADYKINPADYTVLELALTSDTLPLTRVDRYAETSSPNRSRRSRRRPGRFSRRAAARGAHSGGSRQALLARADTRGRAQHGRRATTVNAPEGSLSGTSSAVVLSANDQVLDAAGYRSMVVAYHDGAPVRVGDLGTVVNGPEDDREAAWLQRKPAIIVDIHKQPGFNVVATIHRIKDALPRLAASLPPAIRLSLVGDRTQTITAAVHDVQLTMLITIALVVLVIFFFVRNPWATIIPSISIPLSLLGAFAAMYLLGYSLDNISLVGMTIAVGFVVDDAIVVVENIVRHLEMGKGRLRRQLSTARAKWASRSCR